MLCRFIFPVRDRYYLHNEPGSRTRPIDSGNKDKQRDKKPPMINKSCSADHLRLHVPTQVTESGSPCQYRGPEAPPSGLQDAIEGRPRRLRGVTLPPRPVLLRSRCSHHLSSELLPHVFLTFYISRINQNHTHLSSERLERRAERGLHPTCRSPGATFPPCECGSQGWQWNET